MKTYLQLSLAFGLPLFLLLASAGCQQGHESHEHSPMMEHHHEVADSHSEQMHGEEHQEEEDAGHRHEEVTGENGHAGTSPAHEREAGPDTQ